ncbi:MAG: Transcriptional regulator of ribosomal biogenesis proteins [Chaenotheca gracillima]|nr:MAG: Transcriptional regulator of ribosomal biogenesis proteins [Chaenotheca gracillima]
MPERGPPRTPPRRTSSSSHQIDVDLRSPQPDPNGRPPTQRRSVVPSSSPPHEKLDSSDTPPPLQHSPAVSDTGRASTTDSTPVGTPVTFGFPASSRRFEKEREVLLPWQRKPSTAAGFPQSDLYLDSTLLEPDLADSCFPLFPQPSSSGGRVHAMDGSATPRHIANRNSSASPSTQNKSSNLTSALHDARADQLLDDGGMDLDQINDDNLEVGNGGGRQGSFSINPGSIGQWGSGARPILMQNPRQERPRRESIAGSMVGGMSWGGISVGSWIRDDLIMAGSSPFNPNPSSSQHSSSYLPKMEANFMRDFSCCGLKISNFHNLLQHYEEEHAGALTPAPSSRGFGQNGQTGRQGNSPSNRAAIANNTAAAIQRTQNVQRTQQQQMSEGVASPHGAQQASAGGSGLDQQGQSLANAYKRTTLPTVHDIDGAEDMDMDDVTVTEDDGLSAPDLLASHKIQPQNNGQSQFGTQNDRSPSPAAPSLNLATANLQNQYHQGLRTSQPTTPSSGQYAYQHNPTVSSVNTPTLNTPHLQDQQQQQQQQRHGFGFSKPSSPKTPNEDETDVFSKVPLDVPLTNQGQFFGGNDGFQMGYGAGNGMIDLCIDEPAKRLFSPNGMFNNQMQYGQFSQEGGQFNNDRDFAQRLREQQMNHGVPGTMGLMPGEEPKPFRCPVLGCEKAYKNQNGLKYHKSHGHQNQKLHENGDGTFSIVNPETHVPYPGTLGMEKEKPYRCDFCGKRYKNLNGLKYHRAHSNPCNPDLKMPGTSGAGGPMNPATAGMGGAGGLGGMPMMGMNVGAGGGGGLGAQGTNEGMVS